MNLSTSFLSIFVISLAQPIFADKLFLTPLIRNNSLEQARELSVVHGFNISSHAGYITVNDVYDANLWFWYITAREKNENTPLLIWLQGGPGVTSLYGLFEEFGPFMVDRTGALKDNPYSWHLNFNLLFIDNPVGAGFSYTNDTNGYPTNQKEISEHLYSFIIQFLKVFPELQKVPVYLCGESYGGKHVLSFGDEIHENNPNAEIKINLKGLAIGNGYIDPVSFVGYSEILYQLGFMDNDERKSLQNLEIIFKDVMLNGDYLQGLQLRWVVESIIKELLGNGSIYNYSEEEPYSLDPKFYYFIQNETIKEALHVGQATFVFYNQEVGLYLGIDGIKSAKPILEKLLEHYKIMLYSGQMDVVCAYTLSTKMHRSLNWSGSNEYLNATLKPWFKGDSLIGFTKRAGNMLEVMVRNAGHVVPKDQPERSLLLIDSFINDRPFNEEPLQFKKMRLYKKREKFHKNIKNLAYYFNEIIG